jgi:VIT1/CCC1 family predicted Fe2+/Mn2+ transporter
MTQKCQNTSYLRNFIFGVEDSLVSTVGLLSGIAIAGVSKTTILITGIILIFVEAVSMAAGSFLSESSAEVYIKENKDTKRSILSSLIMFSSYFLSGFIVIFPYIIFQISDAFKISILLSLISLFVLGIIGAKISKINILKNGFKMAIVGGLAILVGTLAGNLLTQINY